MKNILWGIWLINEMHYITLHQPIMCYAIKYYCFYYHFSFHHNFHVIYWTGFIGIDLMFSECLHSGKNIIKTGSACYLVESWSLFVLYELKGLESRDRDQC